MPPIAIAPERNAESKFKIFTAALKAVDGEDGAKRLHCTASSSVEDLHGDTMTAECVRDMATQAKEKSMTIFLNHRYAVPEDVMGKTIGTSIVSRAHDAKSGEAIYDFDLDLEVNQTNVRAVNTYAAIKDAGVKLGVSIGANIEEWDFKDEKQGWWGGLIIKKVNLLEASVVGIPANPRSWVQNAVAALKSVYEVDDTNSATDDGDGAGPLSDTEIVDGVKNALKTAVADGIKKVGTEVPLGATATLTVKADGSSEVVIEDTKTESVVDDDAEAAEAAPEGEATAEATAEDEATKAEEPTSPVDLEAAKLAAADLNAESGDSSPTKELILSLISELEKARQDTDGVVAERDAALASKAASDAMLADAAEIIATIVKTPLGRKTSFAGPVKTFQSRFGDIYSREFLDMIERDK